MVDNYFQIQNLRQFEEVKNNNVGYVLILDIANPNRIHRPRCKYIKENRFRTKVMKNRNKNGSYWWVKNLNIAASKWKFKYCSILPNFHLNLHLEFYIQRQFQYDVPLNIPAFVFLLQYLRRSRAVHFVLFAFLHKQCLRGIGKLDSPFLKFLFYYCVFR